jgi:hypothetical protein
MAKSQSLFLLLPLVANCYTRAGGTTSRLQVQVSFVKMLSHHRSFCYVCVSTDRVATSWGGHFSTVPSRRNLYEQLQTRNIFLDSRTFLAKGCETTSKRRITAARFTCCRSSTVQCSILYCIVVQCSAVAVSCMVCHRSPLSAPFCVCLTILLKFLFAIRFYV